jgi:hypothetical protein
MRPKLWPASGREAIRQRLEDLSFTATFTPIE